MGPHPSHKTRVSDASSYDTICDVCGYTDRAVGGWGDLVYPCPGPPVPAKPLPPRKIKLALDWVRRDRTASGATYWWMTATVCGLVLQAAPNRGKHTFSWSMFVDDGEAAIASTGDEDGTDCKTIEEAQEEAERRAATRLVEEGRRIHKVHEVL